MEAENGGASLNNGIPPKLRRDSERLRSSSGLPEEFFFDRGLIQLLHTEEPIVAMRFAALISHALLRNAAGTRGRNDHVVARAPIRRQRDVERIRRLQADDDAVQFVEIPAKAQRVVNNRSDNALRIDNEDGANRSRAAFPRLDHLVFRRNFHRDIFDKREPDFNVLHSFIFNFFVNCTQPGDMNVQAVNRQADQRGEVFVCRDSCCVN